MRIHEQLLHGIESLFSGDDLPLHAPAVSDGHLWGFRPDRHRGRPDLIPFSSFLGANAVSSAGVRPCRSVDPGAGRPADFLGVAPSHTTLTTRSTSRSSSRSAADAGDSVFRGVGSRKHTSFTRYVPLSEEIRIGYGGIPISVNILVRQMTQLILAGSILVATMGGFGYILLSFVHQRAAKERLKRGMAEDTDED